MERTENKQTENEQTEVAAHIAGAKNNTGAAATEVSLGKFKDVGSLLKAYENLESEFTRRSRRLKELEGEVLRNKEEITRRGASSEIQKGLGEGSSPEKTDEIKNSGDKKDKCEGDLLENAAEKTTVKGAKSGRIDDENRKSAEKEDGKTDDKAESAEKTDEKGEKAEKSEEAADGYDAMEEIIKKYLLSVMKSRPPVTPASGTAVVVPPRKPKSFEEAGMLVKKDFGL